MKKLAYLTLAAAILGATAPVFANDTVVVEKDTTGQASPLDDLGETTSETKVTLKQDEITTVVTTPEAVPNAVKEGDDNETYSNTKALDKRQVVTNVIENPRTGKIKSYIANPGQEGSFADVEKELSVADVDFSKLQAKYTNVFKDQDSASKYADRAANGRSVNIKPIYVNGQTYYIAVFGDVAKAEAPKAEDKKSDSKSADQAVTGKKSPNTVAAAKTATGSKALPKTSAVK